MSFFEYNEDGLRTKKTATSTGTTECTLHGKNIVHMTRGSDSLHFLYDAQGKPAEVIFNGTAYRYLYNLQGDVVALVDGTGTKVVEYTYDAWGKPTSKTGSLAGTLGTVQPFRYRGYVWDEETGDYYLRSRYYRAEWCRFVSTDSIIKGNNLYQYCKNCPTNYLDEDGRWFSWAILLLMQDEFAREVVDHWINGEGRPLVISNNKNWDGYLTSNDKMILQIGNAAYTAFLKGESTFSVAHGSITLSDAGDGGYFTGYDVLNGSNLHNGGFSFYGEIIPDGGNDYIIKGTYIFCDRVDSNEKYADDRFLSAIIPFFLSPGKGRDYDITIEGEFIYHAWDWIRQTP